jgi:RND family efflux transporter MFP subunit
VRIRLQDEPDYHWTGRLAFVDNAFDPASGVIAAYALVDNPGYFLTPGMFGHMQMRGSRPYAGLLIPDQAVVTDQSRQVVYVVGANNVVVQRRVTLGPIAQGLRVIRDGLAGGDRVVIDGLQRARPGRPVTPRAGRVTPNPQAPFSADPPPPAAAATFAGAS